MTGTINGKEIPSTHLHADGVHTPGAIDDPGGEGKAKISVSIENGEIKVEATAPDGKSGYVKGDPSTAPQNGRGHLDGKTSQGKTIQCSQCKTRAKINVKIGAKICAKIGGISMNVTVDPPDNATGITAVMYDPYLKELIFIGKENYTMPSIDLGAFITALTVPKQDQWISIDLYENNTQVAPVSFGDMRLWNTSMGSRLLNGDYLLKNQTIDNISSCYSKFDGSTVTFRVWIQPSKVTLK